MEENIADALKMAGSVLLFVMGLSIAILAFMNLILITKMEI